MAQGLAYTPEQRESIIESIRPFLEAGFSRNKACETIGFDPTTLSKWVQDDEALSMRLRGYENTLNTLALSNIASALQVEAEMEGNRKDMSQWWAERRMKNDFSTKIEQEVKADVDLTFKWADDSDNNNTV